MSINKLFNQIQLIIYCAYAKLRAESERTYAGYLWWILDPLMMLGVYYFVFVHLLKTSEENYVHFLFIGLTVWKWFITSITISSSSLAGNIGLIQQIYLPKAVFPITEIIINTTKFIAVVGLIILIFSVTGFLPSIHYLAIPLVLISQFILIVGIGLFLSAIVPFLPDLSFLIEYFFGLLIFPSGVFFKLDGLAPKLQWVLKLNPLVGILESWRNIFMYTSWPIWSGLIYANLIGVLLIFVGLTLLIKYDRHYPKIIH
jgi:lipopolysaccharide transport system permease protein